MVQRPTTGAIQLTVMALLLGGLATGCPTFKDKHSGVYVERQPAASSMGQSVQVDLFRYGGYARAIVRYFEPDIVTGDPYGEQVFCTWTRSDAFDEDDRTFQLPIERSSRIPEGRLTGTIDGDEMEISIIDTTTGEPIVESTTLEQTSEPAETECESVGDFLIRPTFNLSQSEPNRMPPSASYEIDHPVFSVQWVGVEPYTDPESNSTFYAAINDQGPTTRLGPDRFLDDENALQGVLSLPLPAPPDKVLVPSGETEYALGHLVVVDDSQSDGQFRWNPGEEPIIAAALQRGRRPDAPPDANGTGRAILFVQDELRDLDPALLDRIEGLEELESETYAADSHFYLVDVDVDFLSDEVLRMTLPTSGTNRSIPMRVTDEFLGSSRTRLPRLFPYE
jgi:hypothetical protein